MPISSACHNDKGRFILKIKTVLYMICSILTLAGCSSSSGGTDAGTDAGLPDHTFIHQVSGRTQTATDTAFAQERPSLYRTTDKLPDLDVRTLVVMDGEVWAGTASGLFRFNQQTDKFENVPMPGDELDVVDIASSKLGDGRMLIGLAHHLVLLDVQGAQDESIQCPDTITSIATDSQKVWVGTTSGLYSLEDHSLVQSPGMQNFVVADLETDGQALWIATNAGLVEYYTETSNTHDAQKGALPDDDVRAVSLVPGGGVLAACATGAAYVGTSSDRIITAGVGALPYDDLTSVAAHGDMIAFGHSIGATFIRGDFEHKDYYHSLRWIPAEHVTAVAFEGDSRRWIATDGGISRIDLVSDTLEQKAALMESYNDGFWRLDFVSDDGRRDDPWDLSGTIHNHDHDNDGLWTQMQIVAWSYAAGATGDERYCELARRAMGEMMWQIDIPAVSFEEKGMPRGFVTRSLVRDDEGDVFSSKATQDNWHLVQDWTDGHDYYWKDDTSSDETTGHFFGYPVFYDICAKTDQERATLAEHAGALARYIVDGGFLLIDIDGEQTTWGHWDPERLTSALDGLDKCMENYDLDVCVGAKYGGGWLNAIEILGHMLAAWHMTGDPVFYDAYEELLDKRYAELVDFNDEVFTVTKRATANHSDHELAMLAYHTLIRYEPDDERRQRWIQSMLDMYEYEKNERNPLWVAIIASAIGDGYDLDEALQTLREWPEDWREWLVDNSHRMDAVKDVLDRHGDKQFKTVLPYDEIRTMKWNGNPYAMTDGGDGRSVQAPWPWLLPYWMMRYHGVIQP